MEYTEHTFTVETFTIIQTAMPPVTTQTTELPVTTRNTETRTSTSKGNNTSTPLLTAGITLSVVGGVAIIAAIVICAVVMKKRQPTRRESSGTSPSALAMRTLPPRPDSLDYDAIAVRYANSPAPKQDSSGRGASPNSLDIGTTYLDLNAPTAYSDSPDVDVDTTYQGLNPSTMSDPTYTRLNSPSANEHIYSNEVGNGLYANV
ncbi:Hypp6342 [Branchiostoma lanceolatum]|uniref:Hypp6342 protein n=1 Tax=Branchiostoma lanceolatum TaxID=7740 RepID=A0A8J9YT80_BRALA|nr:Hypp6342 [Branchiostoma lanceolatum]